MSDERGELAKVLSNALGTVTGIYDTSDAEDREIADAILAAGYRRPRQVTTMEELDALPRGVVVREDRHGLIWERQGDGEGGSFWVETGDEEEYQAPAIELPVTVLLEA